MRRIIATAALLAVIAATAEAQTPRITRIEFSPATDEGGIGITIAGTGQCTYTIDFGDGTTDRRTATLPDNLQHTFKADGEYTVVATPEAPCEGVARARLDIRAIKQGIWRLSVEPGPSTEAPEVIVNVEGRGNCSVLLDFGDGKQEKLQGELPAKVSHVYGAPGSYELHAAAESPCRGDVRLHIDVKR
jgi:PKD repeat protein